MLRIFKSNQPFIIFLLVAIAALLRAVIFLYPELPRSEFNHPLGKFLVLAIGQIPLNQIWVQNILAVIITIIEAFYFNRILIKHKIIARGNYLGAYCFLLLSSLFADFLYLTPSLVINLFLLLLIDKLFTIYRHERMSSEIFDLGFIISIASLFYFPALSFIAFLLIGLATIRPVRVNEYFVLLIGVVIPYFLAGVYFFWNDSLGTLWQNILVYGFRRGEFGFMQSYPVWIISLFVFLVTGWAVNIIQLNYFKTVVQTRNYFVVLFWFAALGFLSVFFHPVLNVEHFMWLVIPAAAAVSYAIPEIKRAWIGEIVHLALLLLVIYFQYQNLF